jgi:dTDP-4-amino-4,6-dideoxygalactose transaminase
VSATLLDVWPPLPPGAYLRRRRAELPYPLEDRRCVLFARGRSGLYHGLRALGLGSGDVVLMPAYHHGSEVEAATRAGLACSFYEGDERLEPDVDELEGLLEPGVRALHITHYLGFPQDVARWRAWCDEHGLLLIEDAAQAWLARDAEGRPLGRLGDLAVFCLYKTFGVPDGAALVTRQGREVPTVRGFRRGGVARRHGAWLAARSGLAANLLLMRRRERPYDPEEDFALDQVTAGPGRASLALIRRLAGEEAAAARRAAYSRLLEALGEHVPEPFSELPDGASPFAFPVETNRKADVLSALAQERIQALDLGSVPHPSLPVSEFPAAERRRARTVGVPVHQELKPGDLERVSAVAAAVLSGRRSSRSR